MVRGAHQRAALDPFEANPQAVLLDLGKLLRRVVAGDGQVFLARLQILAHRQDIHAPVALVAHHLLDLFQRFAQADHDAALDQHLRVKPPGIAECGRRPLVAVLRLDGLEQARHRLDVVVEDLWPGLHDDLERFQAALEIGDQHFHRAAGVQLTDAPDDHGEDRRAAVLAVIAVDRGDHGVLQIHRLDRLGHALRLQPIQRRGPAALDIAEAAGARAHIAEHQKGGRARAPAFAHIGAHRFFADGVQRLGAHQALQPLIRLARWRSHLDPIWAAQGRGVGLFRVNPVAGGGEGHRDQWIVDSG